MKKETNKDILLSIGSRQLYFTGNLCLDIASEVNIKKGLTVLTGPNASGKTTFARILEKGRNFRTNKITFSGKQYPKIKYIEFNDIHSFAGISESYYQQRYEAGMNDETPSVEELMGTAGNSSEFRDLCSMFNLKDIIHKKINFLSSGELRKFLIINSMLDSPDLLIIDNPYIGLDTKSKGILNEALLRLKDHGRSVLLLLADKEDAPSFTDNFLYAGNMKIGVEEESFLESDFYSHFPWREKEPEEGADMVCELIDCNINYGDITILRNLNWQVKKGERWSLSGPNGSGKSTLLSLINADNPKGYCNNLYLFGRKRGSGESIWDIKKKIGYVSPEMILHFKGTASVEKLIANGLNDTMGLFVRPSEEQLGLAHEWLRHFKIEYLAERTLNTLSSGERQLVMIARSMIKQPRLLILDEPMHALDKWNLKMVSETLNDFLEKHPSSTLIMVTHNPENLPASIDNHLELKKEGVS